jgi:hypothetical protein
MFGGSMNMGPESVAERLRQERLEELGGREGIEALPGVRKLREWGAAQKRERAQAEAEKLEATEKRLRERAEAEMLELRARMEHDWLASSGTREEFEEAWPRLKARALEERTLGMAAGVDYRDSRSFF